MGQHPSSRCTCFDNDKENAAVGDLAQIGVDVSGSIKPSILRPRPPGIQTEKFAEETPADETDGVEAGHPVKDAGCRGSGGSLKFVISRRESVALAEDADGDSGASDSPSSSSTTFRSTRRTQRQRLLITHTMGMDPSAALQLVIENGGDIKECYSFDGPELGRGAFGIVQKCELSITGATRAVKVISKQSLKSKEHLLRKEIQIMKLIDHPNLVMLHEIFEDQDTLYLVLELCEGGSLYGQRKRAGHLTEWQTAHVMQQILRAVNYLHKHEIVHRDMKADNVLRVAASDVPLETCRWKVSDFGLSCMLKPRRKLNTIAGTLTHMAPEVLDLNYSHSCDVWSCGVLMYDLLCGALPFMDGTADGLKRKIREEHIEFSSPLWLHVTQKAIDFISRLLARGPRSRYSAGAALTDPWLMSIVPPMQEISLPANAVKRLQKFRAMNKLKRAALHIMASMQTTSEISDAVNLFIALDVNGDGMFSIDEFRAKMKTLPVHMQSMTEEEVFIDRKVPTASSSDLQDFTFTEFLAATLDRRKASNQRLLEAAFSSFDKNGDGKVSISELSTGRLVGKMSVDEIMDAVTEVDQDGDAVLDFMEFARMMKSRSSRSSLGDDARSDG